MYAASPDEYYEASQVESKLMSKARKAHELPVFYYFTTVGQSKCTPIQYQRIAPCGAWGKMNIGNEKFWGGSITLIHRLHKTFNYFCWESDGLGSLSSAFII